MSKDRAADYQQQATMNANADRLSKLSGFKTVFYHQMTDEEKHNAHIKAAIDALNRAEEVVSVHPENPVAIDFYNKAVAACKELGINVDAELKSHHTGG